MLPHRVKSVELAAFDDGADECHQFFEEPYGRHEAVAHVQVTAFFQIFEGAAGPEKRVVILQNPVDAIDAFPRECVRFLFIHDDPLVVNLLHVMAFQGDVNILAARDRGFDQGREIGPAARKDAPLHLGLQPERLQLPAVPVAAVSDQPMLLVVMVNADVIEPLMQPVLVDAVQAGQFGVVGQIEADGVIELADDPVSFLRIVPDVLTAELHESVVPAVETRIVRVQVVPDDVVAHDENGPFLRGVRQWVGHCDPVGSSSGRLRGWAACSPTVSVYRNLS